MSEGEEAPETYRRQPGNRQAVFLVHGFTGAARETWGRFPELIAADSDLRDYDVWSWGYPTRLDLSYPLLRYFWTDDPNVATLGQGLRTALAHHGGGYDRLVLIGHSMGGLVIQAFVLEELNRGSDEILGRLTEIVMFGTPSGGLKKAALAAFLKNQIADMNAYGPFIQKLREEWTRLVDEPRVTGRPAPSFRLTLVAGMKDAFVPQASSLDPFPLDEKEIVPGNHVEMVKPGSADATTFLVVKKRLTRGTPTREELDYVSGRSPAVGRYLARIGAASQLGDVQDLRATASELEVDGSHPVPRVWRALGLALLDYEAYPESVRLLQRYIDFRLPGHGGRPFTGDVQAAQQLAIALSGTGQLRDALSVLQMLPEEVRNASESLGIAAGRLKRHWWGNESQRMVGLRALATYRAALQIAKAAEDSDQIVYNGINTAYLAFALGEAGFQDAAQLVIAACEQGRDYWTDASRAEAHLLLSRYPEALEAYRQAQRHAPPARHWTSTGQQTRDIIRRQGDPEQARPILELFESARRDY